METSALNNVSFQISKGERVGIVGLNGAGKSTLLKIIMGILKPSKGNVATFGVNPMTKRKDVSRKLGVVFGQRSQLQWDIPVIDSYQLLGAIFKTENNEKIIDTYKDYFQLGNILNKPVRSLSLGQKMIAEFVGVMLHNPELLILDESTIGLDLDVKKKMISSIKALNKEKTIIFTSHNLEDIYDVCDRVIIINQGAKVFDGLTRDIDRSETPSKVTVTFDNDFFDKGNTQVDAEKISAGIYEFELKNLDEVADTLKAISEKKTILNLEIKSEKLERLITTLSTE